MVLAAATAKEANTSDARMVSVTCRGHALGAHLDQRALTTLQVSSLTSFNY